MLYVNDKQKTVLPPKALSEICARHNFTIEDNRPSISYTNDVFVVLRRGEKFFLKVFTDQFDDPDAGLQEIEIAEKLINSGVPAPTPILYERSDEEVVRNYAAFVPLNGTPLAQGSDQVSMSVSREACYLIEALNHVQGPSGFFRHREGIHNTFQTHREFLEDIVYLGFRRLNERGFSADDLQKEFENWAPDIETGDYALCHNDFTPKHLLVHRGSISGLLDFEWSYFGQKESDYAQWLWSLGVNGFPGSVDNSFDIISERCNAELLGYYSARMFIIASVWTHQNVIQPQYTLSSIQKARDILSRGNAIKEDFIWQGGSPINE